MKKLLIFIAASVTTGRLMASASSTGAAFLDIPVGAGPAALGSAYTALAADAYAPAYNPAGLGFLTGNEMAAQHLSYLESIHYEQLSLVHPFASAPDASKKGIGLSIQYLGSGDISGLDQTGAPIGTFSNHYASYNLAYGQTVTDKLALGVTAKWINAALDQVSANAYALDIGSMYRLSEALTLAAGISNAGTPLKFLSQGDDLPLAFHAAAVFKPIRAWMLTAEGVFEKNGVNSGRFGTEWRPIRAIALRAGYGTGTTSGLDATAGVTAGVGVFAWGQEFAYAFAPYGDLGNAQYFSFVAHFGPDAQARGNLVQYQNIHTHQNVKINNADEVEYQQLIQLLSSDENGHTAEAPNSSNPTD